VEEDREEPHVVARRFGLLVEVGADLPRRLLHGFADAAVELHELERLDRLRLAVLGDLEVALFQIAEGGPVLVRDDDVDANEVDAGAEQRLVRRSRCRRLLARLGLTLGRWRLALRLPAL